MTSEDKDINKELIEEADFSMGSGIHATEILLEKNKNVDAIFYIRTFFNRKRYG